MGNAHLARIQGLRQVHQEQVRGALGERSQRWVWSFLLCQRLQIRGLLEGQHEVGVCLLHQRERDNPADPVQEGQDDSGEPAGGNLGVGSEGDP